MGCVCSGAPESVSSQDHGKGRNRLRLPGACQPFIVLDSWTVSHSSHSVGLPQRLIDCLRDPDGGWAWIGCFSNPESAHAVPGLSGHWPPCKPPSTSSSNLPRADNNVDRPFMGTKLPQRTTVATSPCSKAFRISQLRQFNQCSTSWILATGNGGTLSNEGGPSPIHTGAVLGRTGVAARWNSTT